MTDLVGTDFCSPLWLPAGLSAKQMCQRWPSTQHLRAALSHHPHYHLLQHDLLVRSLYSGSRHNLHLPLLTCKPCSRISCLPELFWLHSAVTLSCLGRVYQGVDEEKYLNRNKHFYHPYPVGYRTVCNAFRFTGHYLKITSTILAGDAGPVFQVSMQICSVLIIFIGLLFSCKGKLVLCIYPTVSWLWEIRHLMVTSGMA